MTVFSSRGQVSFLKVKKNLFRRESSRSNEAIIVNWTNCHPLEVPSGRTRTFRSLFDRNPPVINLRRSESFRRIYRSWHRWPAVNLRLAGGDKEREREKKAANVFFFFKVRKGRNKNLWTWPAEMSQLNNREIKVCNGLPRIDSCGIVVFRRIAGSEMALDENQYLWHVLLPSKLAGRLVRHRRCKIERAIIQWKNDTFCTAPSWVTNFPGHDPFPRPMLHWYFDRTLLSMCNRYFRNTSKITNRKMNRKNSNYLSYLQFYNKKRKPRTLISNKHVRNEGEGIYRSSDIRDEIDRWNG